jgi:hypothetical protein
MNTNSGPVPVALACHPLTPSRSLRAIDVAAGGTAGGVLRLTFTLTGDLAALCIPEPRPSRRVDGLWRHTCCEVFVMAGEGPAYREYNFSPSGEWACYVFRDYRDGGQPVAMPDPLIAPRRGGDRLELTAEVPVECLPPGERLRLGLSAVVEDAHRVLSYWALRHPPGPPDFHHPDAFALALALPATPCVETLSGGSDP